MVSMEEEAEDDEFWLLQAEQELAQQQQQQPLGFNNSRNYSNTQNNSQNHQNQPFSSTRLQYAQFGNGVAADPAAAPLAELRPQYGHPPSSVLLHSLRPVNELRKSNIEI